jgi:hypothetical protein
MHQRSSIRQLKAEENALGILAVLVTLCCLVTACQGNLLTYKGDTVLSAESIPLKVGRHTGQWETRDVRVNYTYSRDADQLDVSGRLKFADQIAYNFANIMYFNLRLFLLNDQGTVLHSTGVATSATFADAQDALSFNKSLQLPPGTVAIAFGYTGEARGTGDMEDAGTTSFFHSPVR